MSISSVKNKMKNNFASSRLTIWASICLAVPVMMMSSPASAQWMVTVVNCIPTSGAVGYGCASEATAAAQLQYLTTGTSTSLMSMASQDGLMPQLRALNSALANNVENQRQGMPNEDLAARNRSVDLAYRQAAERHYRPYTASACRGPSMGGGAGGVVRARDAARDRQERRDQERVLTPTAEGNLLGRQVTGARNARYCTAADVANEIPNCDQTGDLAGANLAPSTLTRAVTPGVTNPNVTVNFNDENSPAVHAIQDYVLIAAPAPGPDIPEAAKNSPLGAPYLVQQRQYNARVLAVTSALMYIPTSMAQLPEGNPFAAIWADADVRTDYQQIYGSDRPFPARPSEREWLDLMVLRQFSTRIAADDLAKAQDAAHLASRQLEMQKLNAYLLWRMSAQQEQTNLLLAHILSNDLDPQTRSNLEQLSRSVSSGGTATAQPNP